MSDEEMNRIAEKQIQHEKNDLRGRDEEMNAEEQIQNEKKDLRGFQRKCPECATSCNAKVAICPSCKLNFGLYRSSVKQKTIEKHFQHGIKLFKSRNPGHVHNLALNQLAKYSGMGYTAITVFITASEKRPNCGILAVGDTAQEIANSEIGSTIKKLFANKVVSLRKNEQREDKKEAEIQNEEDSEQREDKKEAEIQNEEDSAPETKRKLHISKPPMKPLKKTSKIRNIKNDRSSEVSSRNHVTLENSKKSAFKENLTKYEKKKTIKDERSSEVSSRNHGIPENPIILPKEKFEKKKTIKKERYDKENMCIQCHYVYGDSADPKKREPWKQCLCCLKWAHISCEKLHRKMCIKLNVHVGKNTVVNPPLCKKMKKF